MLQALAMRVLSYALIAVALYAAGRFHQIHIDERARDAAIIAAWEQGDRHVERYIARTRALADRATVAERAHRLCLGKLRRPRPADGTASTDSGNRRDDGEGEYFTAADLADDALACKDNAIKLSELQDALRPQLYSAPRWWEFWR